MTHIVWSVHIIAPGNPGMEKDPSLKENAQKVTTDQSTEKNLLSPSVRSLYVRIGD